MKREVKFLIKFLVFFKVLLNCIYLFKVLNDFWLFCFCVVFKISLKVLWIVYDELFLKWISNCLLIILFVLLYLFILIFVLVIIFFLKLIFLVLKLVKSFSEFLFLYFFSLFVNFFLALVKLLVVIINK